MEVTIKHLSFDVDTSLIEADVHRRRSLFGYDIDFIWTLALALPHTILALIMIIVHASSK